MSVCMEFNFAFCMQEELPIKRKASTIPRAMSAKKAARTDSGAGPSEVYNWAKLEAKMEMKQVKMKMRCVYFLAFTFISLAGSDVQSDGEVLRDLQGQV